MRRVTRGVLGWMSRAMVVVSMVSCCGCADRSPPWRWVLQAEPLWGQTYEGVIEVRFGGEFTPDVDPATVQLVTWPELEPVAAEASWSRSPAGQWVTLTPHAPLDGRWYAAVWSAPEPLTEPPLVRGQASWLDEDTRAWPFWGESGPFPVFASFDDERVWVRFSDELTVDDALIATVTQGETVCTLELVAPDLLDGACEAFVPSDPFTLDVAGHRSRGTGTVAPPVHLELTMDAYQRVDIARPRTVPAPVIGR